MPIQVDVDRRRADIAEATFAVAAREGLAAVTLRSVAAEMGASTTTITNYLPTRADLLVNALDQITREWLDELADIVADGSAPAHQLHRLMRASVDWDADEYLRCTFWVAVLTAKGRTVAVDASLRDATSAARQVLVDVLVAGGSPMPDVAADHLMLVLQGVFVSIVEAPESWPPSRTVAVVDHAVATLDLPAV